MNEMRQVLKLVFCYDLLLKPNVAICTHRVTRITNSLIPELNVVIHHLTDWEYRISSPEANYIP